MRDITVKVFRPARPGAGSTSTRILRSLQFLATGIVNTPHIYNSQLNTYIQGDPFNPGI